MPRWMKMARHGLLFTAPLHTRIKFLSVYRNAAGGKGRGRSAGGGAHHSAPYVYYWLACVGFAAACPADAGRRDFTTTLPKLNSCSDCRRRPARPANLARFPFLRSSKNEHGLPCRGSFVSSARYLAGVEPLSKCPSVMLAAPVADSLITADPANSSLSTAPGRCPSLPPMQALSIHTSATYRRTRYCQS